MSGERIWLAIKSHQRIAKSAACSSHFAFGSIFYTQTRQAVKISIITHWNLTGFSKVSSTRQIESLKWYKSFWVTKGVWKSGLRKDWALT